MDLDIGNNDDIYMADSPEEQDAIVRLSSMLEVGFALARTALRTCQWDFEAAVDITFQLTAISRLASGGPARLGLEQSSASSSSQSSSSSSNAAIVMPSPEPHVVSSSDGVATSSQSQPSSSSGNQMELPVEAPPAPEAEANPSGHKRRQSSLEHDVPDLFVPVDESQTSVGVKKQRLDRATITAATFKIPNNNADPPAVNPPLLKAHPLREEQRRSLGWMLSQEAKMEVWNGNSASPGGLLADRMGYGKTSTAIGLISLDAGKPLRQPGELGSTVPLVRRDAYIPSDTTLVVSPSHLVNQWEGEFWKFLGKDGVQICKPVDRTVFAKSLKTMKLTFKCSDFPMGFGISFRKTSPDWMSHLRLGDMACITNISPDARQRFAQMIGSEDAIQCGDCISSVQYTKVQTLDGQVISNKEVAGYEEVTRVLSNGGSPTIVNKIPKGFIHLENGVIIRTYDYVRVPLLFSPDSTMTFTTRRIDKDVPRTKVVKGAGPLKVLTIKGVHELDVLQQRDFISQFHVILASACIQSGQKYAKFITTASETDRGFGLRSPNYMEQKLEAMGKNVKEWCKDRDAFERLALPRSPALFEAVFWRRVILDEFHESEAWQYRVREMLSSLSATHKWGLSGTPPLGSAAAVAEVAGLLGYASASKAGGIFSQALHHSSSLRCHNKTAKQWFASQENQDSLKAAAEIFVKDCIRQNTSDLVEQIGIVEHEEIVEHTSEERLIYNQACHDQGIFDLTEGYDHLSLAARAELLKRCAHFDMGEAESASSAVNRLGNDKRKYVDNVEKQLWVEVARTTLFELWDPVGKEVLRSTSLQHPDAKALVDRVLSSSTEDVDRHLAQIEMVDPDPSVDEICKGKGKFWQSLLVSVTMRAQDGSMRLRPEVRLIQPIRESEYYRDDRHRHAVVHAVARRAKHQPADRELSKLMVCEHACCSRLLPSAISAGLSDLVKLVDKAHRSLQFYTQQLGILKKEEEDDNAICSICMEPWGDIRKMAMIPCSHFFHMDCIKEALAMNQHCPECRTPVDKSHVSSVAMELKPPEPKPDKASGPSINMSVAWKKNGSKLNAVAERLREIRRQDPKAKALVFVQWEDLEGKVCRALRDHDVSFLSLSMGAHVLNRFQEDDGPNAPYVLVLSLQRAASGANLTSGSHVLFVHPMNAESVQTAAAYERQALARIRRIGQTRKEVHVWRFVTKHTVEEHIWKLHRGAPEEAEADHVGQVGEAATASAGGG